jgi:hypothetical protein
MSHERVPGDRILIREPVARPVGGAPDRLLILLIKISTLKPIKIAAISRNLDFEII